MARERIRAVKSVARWRKGGRVRDRICVVGRRRWGISVISSSSSSSSFLLPFLSCFLFSFFLLKEKDRGYSLICGNSDEEMRGI